MSKVGTAVAALGLVGALLLGAGCAEIGDVLYRTSTATPKTNHEYQRESALRFRTFWANVERIRYKEDGSSGPETWAANAVASIDGKDHEVIIGPNALSFPFGDMPPDMRTLPPSAPAVTLTVIYSDGTSEVIP